jgi:hypothetical protein
MGMILHKGVPGKVVERGDNEQKNVGLFSHNYSPKTVDYTTAIGI